MRFWLSVNAIVLPACTSVSVSGQTSALTYRHDLRARRTNEWRLARLVPGQTKFARAEKVLGEPSSSESKHSATWTNCREQLVVESNDKNVVQTIRVSEVFGSDGPLLDCFRTATGVGAWKTGLGLRVKDSADRAIRLYGQPTSHSPSTRGGQQLELLYYAFDWAGPDVPQVMEVLCTAEKDGKPGRVVEIALAAPSL